jgi:hypothetical protein
MTEPTNLEIHEVTIGVSLSTETSPATEFVASLNPSEKYEHMYQVEDLNPDR